MSIGISPCPGCGTLLLDDTVECHRCHHVFDRQRADELALQDLPTDNAVIQDLGVCHNCGEAVRSGLVRCWNCAVFLRADIQAAFDVRQGEQSGLNPVDRNPQSRSMLKALPHTASSMSETDKNAQLAAYAASRNGHGSAPGAKSGQLAESGDNLPVAADDDDDFELSGDIFLAEDTSTEQLSPPSGASLIPYIPLMEIPQESATPPVTDEPKVLGFQTPLQDSPVASEPVTSGPAEHSPTTGESIGTPETGEDSGPGEELSEDDILLQIALTEEKEELEQASNPRKRGFVTSCDAGCKVRVMDHHRGKVGKCPKCGARLAVPLRKTTGAGAEEEAPLDPPVSFAPLGKFVHVMQDVQLHTVARGKLKLKAGAHTKDFALIDLAIDPQTLVMLSWPKGTLLKPTTKKIPEFRATLKSKLIAKPDETDLSPAQVTAAPLSPESLAIVQPTVPGGNETLTGLPVFGEGRIAVEILNPDEKSPQQFLTFNLSQFRQFAQAIRQGTSWTNFAEGSGIPLSSELATLSCHYNETPVLELQQVAYFQNDKSFTLQLTGYRCQSCGLVVSEDGRKKEKIGGKTPASIKSAKCPKCQKPFGLGPLYTLQRGKAKA
jgi:rubredoxin